MNRTREVIDYFTNNMPALVYVVAADDFRPSAALDELDPNGTYAPFGYLPPRCVDGRWSWDYCPAMIAEQSAEFPPRLFAFYLSVIENRIAAHWARPDLQPLEREQACDALVYDLASSSAQAIAEMQMRVLDRMARAR